MRVRIITQPTGVMDGVSLDQFRIGEVYELATQLGCVFRAEGWAEMVSEGDPAETVHPSPAALAKVRQLVLVVEDEPELRRLTESILSAHGYHVILAAHGKEAIDRLREQCPDLIVLDLNMPVMNGWEFRAEQRYLADESRAGVPVLLVTGEPDVAKQVETLGAVGALRKPFDPDDLLHAVTVATARQM